MTKTRYVPQGFVKYTPENLLKHSNLFEVYAKLDDPKKFAAIFYTGKQTKHTWYYGFPRLDDMEAKINETVSRLVAHEERKAQRKIERKAPHSLKVGDVLYSSWGYDQTNIDFYKVVNVLTNHTVQIIKVHSKIVSTPDISSQRVVAVPESQFADEKTLTKRVSANNTVKITSYASAYPWDGHPLYETATGSGH